MYGSALSHFGQLRRTFGHTKNERDSISLEREATENVFSAACVETVERQEDIIDNIIFNKL